MTFEQLRIFVAVAERQHVTQAAQALNLAQSAASHAIASLESEYDVTLFDRVGRRIELTDAGRLFLTEARLILAQVGHAERLLHEIGGLKRGTLSLHASQTIAGYWLPRHLAAFRETYPDIDIKLSIGNSADVAEHVAKGMAELGFAEGEVEATHLDCRAVARDQLVLVVATSHSWAEKKRVTASDLTSSNWVMRERGSGTRAAFEHALRDRGIDPASLPVALELPSNEAVRSAVESGLGATVISASVAAPGIEAGLLHQLAFDLPDRAFHLLRRKDRHISRAAEAFLRLMASGQPRMEG